MTAALMDCDVWFWGETVEWYFFLTMEAQFLHIWKTRSIWRKLANEQLRYQRVWFVWPPSSNHPQPILPL